MTSIAALSAADRATFVAAIGFAFEHSPWIAEAAWQRRPFADLDDLLTALNDVVAQAPEARRIALIAAHPDLAGRVARDGRLTAASLGEQAAAGLDRLTSDELARFPRPSPIPIAPRSPRGVRARRGSRACRARVRSSRTERRTAPGTRRSR